MGLESGNHVRSLGDVSRLKPLTGKKENPDRRKKNGKKRKKEDILKLLDAEPEAVEPREDAGDDHLIDFLA